MSDQSLNRRSATEIDAMRQNLSKEDVLRALQECEREMGHVPSLTELRMRIPSLTELRMRKGVYERHIRKHFVNYTSALAECGMRREGPGYRLSPEALFNDWAGLARKLGKIPNINEYDLHSRYSHRPMVSRFGNWRQVPMGMLTLAEENGWEEEW